MQNTVKGFSMIELLIVISIITILSSISYMTYSEHITETENTKKKADMDVLQTEIELEMLKNEAFPTKIQ